MTPRKMKALELNKIIEPQASQKVPKNPSKITLKQEKTQPKIQPQNPSTTKVTKSKVPTEVIPNSQVTPNSDHHHGQLTQSGHDDHQNHHDHQDSENPEGHVQELIEHFEDIADGKVSDNDDNNSDSSSLVYSDNEDQVDNLVDKFEELAEVNSSTLITEPISQEIDLEPVELENFDSGFTEIITAENSVAEKFVIIEEDPSSFHNSENILNDVQTMPNSNLESIIEQEIEELEALDL